MAVPGWVGEQQELCCVPEQCLGSQGALGLELPVPGSCLRHRGHPEVQGELGLSAGSGWGFINHTVRNTGHFW